MAAFPMDCPEGQPCREPGPSAWPGEGSWLPPMTARRERGNLLTPSTLAQPHVSRIFRAPPPTSVVLVIAPVAREQARSASRVSQQTIGRLVAAHTSKKRGPGRRGRRGSLSRWQDGREPPSERASAAPRCRRQPFGPSGPRDASRSPRGGAAPVSAAHSDPTSSRRPAPAARRRRRPGTHLPRLRATPTAHEHTRRDQKTPQNPRQRNIRERTNLAHRPN